MQRNRVLKLPFLSILLATVFVAAMSSNVSANNVYIPEKSGTTFAFGCAGTTPFSEGLGAVLDDKSKKWGFIDGDGNVVIPFVYDEVHLFTYKTAVVLKDGKYGVIDTAGDIVVPFEYDEGPMFEGCEKTTYEERFILFRKIDKGNTVSLFDKQKKAFIIEGQNSIYSLEDSLIRVENTKNKYGYANLMGNFVIPQKYDLLEPFSEGLAAAGIVDYSLGYPKYGYINKKGETVIPFIYGRANSFSEGVATVGVEFIEPLGLWNLRLIDKSGKTIKEGLIYTNITEFLNGQAVVTKIDPNTQEVKYGLINKEGGIIEPVEFDNYEIINNSGKEAWSLSRNKPGSNSQSNSGYKPIPSGAFDSAGNYIDYKTTSNQILAKAKIVNDKKVSVKLNSELVTLNPEAKLINGSTFIPLRGVFEKIKCDS